MTHSKRTSIYKWEILCFTYRHFPVKIGVITFQFSKNNSIFVDVTKNIAYAKDQRRAKRCLELEAQQKERNRWIVQR